MAILHVPGTYSTIAAAIAAASSLDTIVVAAGYAGPKAATVSVNMLTFDAPASVTDIILTLAAGVNTVNLSGSSPIQVVGNSGSNTVNGNKGHNVLNGGVGADTMAGSAGNDTYVVDNAGDVIIEGTVTGVDTVESSISYSLGANVERLTLTGSSSVNAVGNSLANTLIGNSGNNVLNGGGGADTMIGGAGNDTYIVDNVSDLVVEYTSAGTDLVQSRVSFALGHNLENLILTGTANIDGTGNTLANSLTGNSGNNILSGGGGKDTLFGKEGDDTYIIDSSDDVVTEYAGQGTDTIYASVHRNLEQHVENLTFVGSANLHVNGNALNNTLIGNSGNNHLNGVTGLDTMIGGLGNDTYTVFEAGDVVIENENQGIDTINSRVSFTLGAHVENLELSNDAGNINAIGNDLNNRLRGNTHNNVIDGGGGIDSMEGSYGDDTYVVDNVADVVVEYGYSWGPFEGTDTILSSVSYATPSHVENLTLTGAANINAGGNKLDNFLTGNSGNNVLNGSAGADTMAAGDGNDIYVVDDAGDVIIEGSAGGIDTVQSYISHALATNVENLTLIGAAGVNATGNELSNKLHGNASSNTLSGGNGDDILIGKEGNDTLIGGAGADSFMFTTALGAGNIDTINSFVVADDAIGLDFRIFTALSAGALPAGAFNSGASASEADDRILFDSGTGALRYDADGLGGVAPVQFATISGISGALAADDFFVL